MTYDKTTIVIININYKLLNQNNLLSYNFRLNSSIIKQVLLF